MKNRKTNTILFGRRVLARKDRTIEIVDVNVLWRHNKGDPQRGDQESIQARGPTGWYSKSDRFHNGATNTEYTTIGSSESFSSLNE